MDGFEKNMKWLVDGDNWVEQLKTTAASDTVNVITKTSSELSTMKTVESTRI